MSEEIKAAPENVKVERRHASTTLYPALSEALDAAAAKNSLSRYDMVRKIIADAMGMPAELPKPPKAVKEPKPRKKKDPATAPAKGDGTVKPAKPKAGKAVSPAAPKTVTTASTVVTPAAPAPATAPVVMDDIEDDGQVAPPPPPKTRKAETPEAIAKARKENLAKVTGKSVPAAPK